MPRKNNYLGSSLETHIKEKYKDNEFAQHFDMQQEKLKLAKIIATKQPSIARLENSYY